MTHTKPHSTLSRFRYIDPQTDQEYRGEAVIYREGFNEEYEGGQSVYAADILRVWQVSGIEAPELHPADLQPLLRTKIEERALEQYHTPPPRRIDIPTDWDDLVEVEKIQCVINVRTKRPIPSGAPGLAPGCIDSITPLHIQGENAYVVSSTAPPSDTISAIRRLLQHA